MYKTKINLNPGLIFKYLLLAISFFVVTNLVNIYIIEIIDRDSYPRKIFELFYLDSEDSLATVFSFLQLLASSIILFFIFMNSRKENHKNTWGWFGLAMIFLFLSLDEILQLHESVVHIFRANLDLSGYLYFSWVVPYSIGVILFFIIYLRFLSRLKKDTALSFLAAGSIFILGAVGIEMIGGHHVETNGRDVYYSLLATLEEFLEMIGISYFIYALLKYLAFNESKLVLRMKK